MSTSSNQVQQRGGGRRRQPFLKLHANTLSAAAGGSGGKGASDAAAGSNGIGGGPLGASDFASEPIKNESRRKMRGILSSIVTRGKKGKGAAAPGRGGSRSSSSSSSSSGSSIVAAEEKKAVDASIMKNDDEGVKPPGNFDSSTQITESAKSDNISSGVPPSIFRQPADTTTNFWNDEMEGLLEIKLANPISDDSADIVEDDALDEKALSESLAAELLDSNVSGETILWSSRVQEDEHGCFKILVDC